MGDPITTLGFGVVAAYLGKDGLEKLLGPTADYLGAGIKDFTQKRVESIGKILTSANKKLGDKIEIPGEVPPKVLRIIINEGSYATDDLSVEYFGGILASARTEEGRDDRGARLAKTIDGLSTYQLRAHYLIYATVLKMFSGENIPFNAQGREQMKLFIPLREFCDAMEFSASELNQISRLFAHIFFGLGGDGLIENRWRFGPKEEMLAVTTLASAEGGGVICQPSGLGAELFLSAFGKSDVELTNFCSQVFPCELENVPYGFENAVATPYVSL